MRKMYEKYVEKNTEKDRSAEKTRKQPDKRQKLPILMFNIFRFVLIKKKFRSERIKRT